MKMTATFEEVTPDKASEWLKLRYEGQRTINTGRVKKFARSMKAKTWIPGVATVAFDVNGALNNGQHTLNGVVLSGETQMLLVVRGMPERAFAFFDGQGSQRQPWEIIKGAASARDLYGLATYLWFYQNGVLQTNPGRIGGYSETPTQEEVCDIIAKNLNLVKYQVQPAFIRNIGFPRKVYQLCLYLFSQQDPAKAELFFDQYQNLINLGADSPALTLRHYVDMRVQRAGRNGRLSPGEVLAWFILAWNSHVTGTPLKKIHYLLPVDGVARQEFPRIAKHVPGSSSTVVRTAITEERRTSRGGHERAVQTLAPRRRVA